MFVCACNAAIARLNCRSNVPPPLSMIAAGTRPIVGKHRGIVKSSMVFDLVAIDGTQSNFAPRARRGAVLNRTLRPELGLHPRRWKRADPRRCLRVGRTAAARNSVDAAAAGGGVGRIVRDQQRRQGARGHGRRRRVGMSTGASRPASKTARRAAAPAAPTRACAAGRRARCPPDSGGALPTTQFVELFARAGPSSPGGRDGEHAPHQRPLLRQPLPYRPDRHRAEGVGAGLRHAARPLPPRRGLSARPDPHLAAADAADPSLPGARGGDLR